MRQYQKKYSKELLEPFVKGSQSVAEVMTKLGLRPSGGNHRHLTVLFERFEIDTTHFTGSGWNRGLTAETDERVHHGVKQKYTDDEVFKEHSPIGSSSLKRRLFRLGWKYQCTGLKLDGTVCGLAEWYGGPIALHLDHINGVHDDNRFENLRFLCPNCHQQTDTWGSRNALVAKRQTRQLEGLVLATG